jgi:glutamyl-tRNA reductase
MFFIDLAVPRDIESNISEFEAVKLYNIDDLQHIINKGRDVRQTAAIEAERLIEIELENYARQHRSRKANKLICDYRQQMHLLGQKELQRAIKKLSSGECQLTVLKELSDRLVNKLAHSTTIGLQNAAKDNQLELLDLAPYLLDPTQHEKIS